MNARPGNFALAAALAAVTAIGALPAEAHRIVSAPLVTMEIYDRQDGSTLPVYDKNGQRWIVGVPGHEYKLRLRNLTGERVLAVTSVDGVNVVSGETAAPDQTGYVIGAYGTVEIEGWRKSLSRTAAFYFTDLGDSYAARTGRPDNVGVIGVAVFREKPVPIVYAPPVYRERRWGRTAAEGAPAEPMNRAEADAQRADAAPPPPVVPAPAVSEATRASGGVGQAADAASAPPAARPMAKIGTGHGREETSVVTMTNFERASASPNETVAIRYDRRENLVAMGILPPPRYAQRQPDPFPGLRFAPDPR